MADTQHVFVHICHLNYLYPMTEICTAIFIMYTFALCLHIIIHAFCWDHYAADQYSGGHLAWWRWMILTLKIVLSDRATLDLMDLLVEMVLLESR